MIINIKKAILHILDANSGVSVYSQEELDMENKTVLSYISDHIDKVCDDPGLRHGDFKENSGFKYQLTQYISGETDFKTFSASVAEKLYSLIGESDMITSSDLIVCECVMNDKQTIAIMKCDNKVGFIHQVVHEGSIIKNEIINHYAIMPTTGQKFSEYAFIDMDSLSIKYKPKKINVEGEKIDMLADGLLECDFDYSTKESFNTITRLAKKITEEYAGNEIDTEAKIKQYVKETAIATDNIAVEEVAESVFDNSPSAREEFVQKVREAEIP